MILGLVLGAAAMAAPAGEVFGPQLMADVQVLADDAMQGRLAGSPNGAAARAFIERRLAAIGLPVERESFRFDARGGGTRDGVNVWTRIAGTKPGRGWIVLTAHYDHVGVHKGEIFNGADDNASGVAVLLALAGRLKAVPPEHDVMLVWLDAEEQGLKGAQAFVKAPPVPVSEMLLNVNLDMVSRNDKGVIYAAGAGKRPALRPVLDAVAAEAPATLKQGYDSGGGRDDWTMLSDQGAFHAAGVPFVYFGVEDHADYHKPTDDVGRIDPDFFERAAETIVMAVRALDGADAVLREAKGAAKAME